MFEWFRRLFMQRHASLPVMADVPVTLAELINKPVRSAKFSTIIDPEDGEILCWIGYVPGVAGINVVGDSREECVSKLRVVMAWWNRHPEDFWALQDKHGTTQNFVSVREMETRKKREGF